MRYDYPIKTYLKNHKYDVEKYYNWCFNDIEKACTHYVERQGMHLSAIDKDMVDRNSLVASHDTTRIADKFRQITKRIDQPSHSATAVPELMAEWGSVMHKIYDFTDEEIFTALIKLAIELFLNPRTIDDSIEKPGTQLGYYQGYYR